MKYLRRCIIPSVFIFAVMMGGSLRGDVVVLKSGERYEGKVISEDATTVTMEYNPTPNTRDTRTVNKADIQELIKLTPSQAEFAERKLDQVLPTADLLSPADYESMIQDRLRSFINKFPGTPESEKVEEMVKELSAEKERVVKGELKVDGKWLSAEDVKRDAYNIDAYRLRYAMNQKAAENTDLRYLEAIRLFDTLQTKYPASLSYVNAVPEAIEVLDNLSRQLNTMLVEYPILAKERESGLKSLTGPNAQATKSAVEAEIANFKATAEREKKDKVKWKTFYKYDEKSLKEALATVTKERTVLGTLDVNTLKEENEQLTGVIRSIADEDAVKAKQLLGELPKATMINKTAVTNLEKEVRALESTIKERRKAESDAKVMQATTQSSDAGTEPVDAEERKNALAEALKKAQQDKKSDKKEEGDEGDNPEKKAAASKASKAASSEGADFTTYIPYIGGVLLIVLILAIVFGKKKPKEDAK